MKTKRRISGYIFRGTTVAVSLSSAIFTFARADNLLNRSPNFPIPQNAAAVNMTSAPPVSPGISKQSRTLSFAERVAYAEKS